MRVLFVTYYYAPEPSAAAVRTSDLARRLTQMGHEVTVLTTLPNYPTGVIPVEYRQGRRRAEVIDGVRVIRVRSLIIPGTRPARRLIGQLSFGLLASWFGARRAGAQDVVIIESPPLFTAIAGRRLARRKHCPFIFTVSDLWPDAAIQLGMLRNPLAIWWAKRLERSTYRQARGIRTVTRGLEEALLARGVPQERVFTVPNGVDTARFAPQPQDEARNALGWDDRFTVLYAGTVGLVQGLQSLLDTAELLRAQTDIRFVISGEGAMRAQLQAEAERRALRNVTFLPPRPHADVPQLIAGADVCFASLRDLPVFEATLPIKLFEAMACGKPLILAATEGLASEVFIHQAQAGIHVAPERPTALAEAIVRLRDDPALARRFGAQGRAYAVDHFDRGKLASVIEAQLRDRLHLSREVRPVAVRDPAHVSAR